MSEQKVSKNKVGARCLTDGEARAILPTYDKIYDQIEQFRKGKTNKEAKGIIRNGEENIQKTNNIGILGVRGAGKTSVLKTIRQHLLRHNKNKDVILPIVIPENLSESSTLMATVLGMINYVVKQKEDELKKEGNGICIRKNRLREKYEEVIKQYTFIQKEYRDILIHEYTTEGDYVRDSAKVFNSDTEFINRFNELVDELVEEKEGLLFLFIDDIDLSTYRCAEVVKILLSYLANENIVAFISGDLDTFEEALTLDFLRQEKALRKDIIHESMLEGRNKEKTLLDSKKQLSYEYLKKILPPGYRHNIKYWSLEEKGGYGIAVDGSDETKMTLAEVLSEALKDWIDPTFFYYKIEKGNKEIIPYTYHLFDDTSRGLNNVYNVLFEIAEKRKNEKEEGLYLEEKKQLLDTIIASKLIYNKYRNEIQKNMIVIGETEIDSRVFFDNAQAVIYEKKKKVIKRESQINEDNAVEGKGYSRDYIIEDAVERFSLFILIDFAARLLYEKDKYMSIIKIEDSYIELKKKAMLDLLFNPLIAEKIVEVSIKKWEYKVDNTIKEVRFYDMMLSFLMESDIIFNLVFYKNIPLVMTLELLKKQDRNSSDMNVRQEIIIAFWKAITLIARAREVEVKEVLVEYYSLFWKEFEYIQTQLSSSITQNIAMKLFDKECEKVSQNITQEVIDIGEKFEKRERIKRILANTIAVLLELNEEDKISEGWKNNPDEFDSLEIKIFQAIDSEKLWKEEIVENIIGDLNVAIYNAILMIAKSILDRESNVRLATKAALASWNNFIESKDGVSITKAKETKEEISKILRETSENLQDGIVYDTYHKIITEGNKLAKNTRVRYGRYEVSRFLHDLQKSHVEMSDIKIKWNHLTFLLQCSYKYKEAYGLTKNANENAEILQDITKALMVSHKEADINALDEFIEKLNKGMEVKITNDEFERLFN